MSEYNNEVRALDSVTADEGTCPAVGYQKVDVCVPVTVEPYANVTGTVTTCCGDATVVEGSAPPCSGSKKGVCEFKMIQTLCVAVNVEFGATATVGDPYVDCIEASAEDICINCESEED